MADAIAFLAANPEIARKEGLAAVVSAAPDIERMIGDFGRGGAGDVTGMGGTAMADPTVRLNEGRRRIEQAYLAAPVWLQGLADLIPERIANAIRERQAEWESGVNPMEKPLPVRIMEEVAPHAPFYPER